MLAFIEIWGGGLKNMEKLFCNKNNLILFLRKANKIIMPLLTRKKKLGNFVKSVSFLVVLVSFAQFLWFFIVFLKHTKDVFFIKKAIFNKIYKK